MRGIIFFSIFCFCFFSKPAFSQFDKNYIPLDTTSSEKGKVINGINNRLERDLLLLKGPYKNDLKKIYKARATRLVKQVEDNEYIYDVQINNYIQQVLDNILANNTIKNKPKALLVSRSHKVNAFCTGEGILVVNIGLLRRITNESQLAFVLAHEIAHYELNHVNQLIAEQVSLFTGKNTKKRLKETANGPSQQVNKTLDLLKELVYEGSRHKRKDESQADSLGMVLFSKTKYDTEEAYTLLHILDHADQPKYPYDASLKTVFSFSKYPFKEKWLEEEYSAFGAVDREDFLLNKDSVKSHPGIKDRIQYLKTLHLGHQEGQKDLQPTAQLESIVKACDFEVIQSTYRFKSYDESLFLSLQLLQDYPQNDYLKTIISRIMVELFFARKNHKYGNYVPHTAIQPHEKLQIVNTFLHRLRMGEIGQLAFHYLNHDQNFNSTNEEHYLLLWQISKHIDETIVQEKVKSAYLAKFPNGKYSKTIN